MTYREYVKKRHPEFIDEWYFGGVDGCPGSYCDGAPRCGGIGCFGPSRENCTNCWDQTMPGTEEVETDKSTIHKIIDDAIAKKDRSVMIFISKSGTTISVLPLDDKKPRWVRKGIDSFCPECNSRSKFESPYCPVCGEKLALPENFWQVPQED